MSGILILENVPYLRITRKNEELLKKCLEEKKEMRNFATQ